MGRGRRKNDPPIHGVLVVDKPGGMTSADVVRAVKKRVGISRVGHTGTLDPMATGVLPLCLGEATKIAPFLLKDEKIYEGEGYLGIETDTLDREGGVRTSNEARASEIIEEDLIKAISTFQGEILQRPPMYSAVKHQGQRLHTLARAGIEVEREERPIVIHEFRLDSTSLPRFRFRVRCSAGTYIRVLVAEVGKYLGCGAHLYSLRRVMSSGFTLDQAISLEDVGSEIPLIPLKDTMKNIFHLVLEPNMVSKVANGLQLRWGQVAENKEIPSGLVRLLTPEGELLAIASVNSGRLQYKRVFTYALTKGS